MDLSASLRRPEYTGERRCLPCTVVNVALVAVAGVALVIAGRPPVGAAAVAVGLVLVALRGYVVPFTPRFAPRLVALVPGADGHLGDHGEVGGSLSGADPDPDDLLETLVAAEVVALDGDRLVLDPAFETAWHGAMDDLAALPPGDLADAVAAESPVAGASAVSDERGEWIALDDSRRLVSRPRAIGELAAMRALEGHVDAAVRPAAARSLLQFLDACPACGDPLESASAVDCCGGHANPRERPAETLVCPSCVQRVVEKPVADPDR